MRIFKGFDLWLFISMLLLGSSGITVLYSTAPEAARTQLFFLLFGLAVYFFVSFLDFRPLRALSPYFYLLNLFFLLVTLTFGIYSKGAVRWIPLGFADLTLQPSEFMKLSLVLILAGFFSSRFWDGTFRSFLLSLLITTIPFGLVFIQPDFGTASLLILTWLFLVLLAGVKRIYLVGLILLIVVSLPIFGFFLKSYQRERLFTFFSPRRDPLGAGYHVLQSQIAVGSGRFLGRGFGRGTQSHLRFLPEYQTDFVFAALAEEWGFLGAVVVLLLYLLMLFRILILASRSYSFFGQLLLIGIFVLIFAQVGVNLAMNLGLAPITGVPLPLLSAGGSSLFLTLILLGLTQAVARRNEGV